MYSGRPRQWREHWRLPRDFLLTDSNFQVTAQCGNTQLARGSTHGQTITLDHYLRVKLQHFQNRGHDVSLDSDVAVKEDGRTSCGSVATSFRGNGAAWSHPQVSCLPDTVNIVVLRPGVITGTGLRQECLYKIVGTYIKLPKESFKHANIVESD